MIKQQRHRHRFVLFFSLLSLLYCSGCIDEDTSNCPPADASVDLYFSYTLNEEQKDLFEKEVHHLDLYFYDDKHTFIRKHSLRQDTLDLGKHLSLQMSPGQYNLVVWGNANNTSDYTCAQAQQLEDMELQATACSAGGMTTTSDSLFYGFYRLSVDRTVKDHYIDLQKNTHDIRVLLTVKNSPKPVQIGDYIVNISGGNGSYGFDNRVKGMSMQSISQYALVGKDSLLSQSRTLRVNKGDDMRLSIQGNKSVIVHFDRILSDDLLKDSRITQAEDLDKIHQFLLVYEIDLKSPAGEPSIVLVKTQDWGDGSTEVPLW